MTKKLRVIIFFVLTIFIIAVGAFVVFQDANTGNNTEIVFTTNGNLSKYKISGFNTPEDVLTWTIDNEASIKIPVKKINKKEKIILSVDALPFLHTKIKKQVVDVYANDVLLGTWTFKQRETYSIDVPASLINKSNVLDLRFQINTAKSSKELKISPDDRKFGIAFVKMTLFTTGVKNPNHFSNYVIGDEISFGKNGNSNKYIGSGWSSAESKFTWTDGNEAFLNMFIEDAKNKNLQLNLVGRGILVSNDSIQKVTVYANDKELTTWDFDNNENNYLVVLPENLTKQGTLQIKFRIHKTVKPANDSRQLGIAVSSVKISQVFASKTKIKIARWLKNKVLKSETVEK